MNDITIKVATKKEIPEILGLLYELGRPKPQKDSEVEIFRKLVRKYVSDSDKSIFIAVHNEIEIVGAASVMLLSRLNQSSLEMYIPELVVLQKYQRKGIGKKLISSCIDYAKKRKCHRIRLESGNQRKESHQFYHSLGFVQSSLFFSLNLEE